MCAPVDIKNRIYIYMSISKCICQDSKKNYTVTKVKMCKEVSFLNIIYKYSKCKSHDSLHETALYIYMLYLLGDSGGVVNSLDFCLALLKSLGCFYFRCVLSLQWKAVIVNLQIVHSQL